MTTVLVESVTGSRINLLRKYSGMTLLVLFFFFSTLPARADDYADPSFSNVAKTMVRFNAIDLKENNILDEYAMITDCDLVKYYYSDDFKWNEVRAAIKESVRLNIATFPTQYHYDNKVQLDRYDFKQKNFKFSDRATIRNINAFVFVENPDYRCGEHMLRYLPTTYRAVLDVPVTVLGLPFAEDDADQLLHRMDGNGNADHVVYVRFRLRVVNIDPLRKLNSYSERPVYAQDKKNAQRTLRLDVRLDSIDFYEDQDMTRLIYTYRP